jgi:hypothetical protein
MSAVEIALLRLNWYDYLGLEGLTVSKEKSLPLSKYLSVTDLYLVLAFCYKSVAHRRNSM